MRTDFNEASFELSQQKLMDRMDAQQAAEESERASADAFTQQFAQPAINALRDIPQYARSEQVTAAIVRALAAMVKSSPFAHRAEDVLNALDNLSDDLEAV